MEHQRQHRLLLDVVVVQRVAVLQLLALEDKALLLARDALRVPDDALHAVDRVAGPDVECDCLPLRGLHGDLHAIIVISIVISIVIGIIIGIALVIIMVIIIAMVISMVISTALLLVLDRWLHGVDRVAGLKVISNMRS